MLQLEIAVSIEMGGKSRNGYAYRMFCDTKCKNEESPALVSIGGGSEFEVLLVGMVNSTSLNRLQVSNKSTQTGIMPA